MWIAKFGPWTGLRWHVSESPEGKIVSGDRYHVPVSANLFTYCAYYRKCMALRTRHVLGPDSRVLEPRPTAMMRRSIIHAAGGRDKGLRK